MSAPDPPPPWVTVLTAGVIGLTALGVVAGLVVVITAHGWTVPPVEQDRGRLESIAHDMGLRVILRILPLAADGRVDVYAVLLHERNATEEIRRLCTSARSGEGPSTAEIDAGDYRHFPYQRHRGQPDDRETLLLWDRAPTNGERLVARSDGTVFTVSEATIQDFFAAHPGQE